MKPHTSSPARRRALAAGGIASLLALAAIAGAARAQTALPPGLAFELISPAEARTEAQAATRQPEAPRTRSLAPARPAPTIRVLAPSQVRAVAAPLRIELAFEPLPGTRVMPSTFRVLYGVLKIDLTERLRRFATITEQGVVVEQAQVPDGLHRLFLMVTDDQGNQAEQELRVRVGTPS